MEPLISVIVPIYNGEKYVNRCVYTLLQQTYHNLEIILVDDGSKDQTYVRCKQLEQKSEKIKVYTKTNGGAASARNFGLKRIHGEFVAYMDVDDIVMNDYIEYLYHILTKYDADVAMCDCYKMSVREKQPQRFKVGKVTLFSQTEAIENLFYRKGITAYPVLKLWKKEVIQEGEFPEHMLYGEDFVYVYEMLKKCNRVAYGEKVAYIYFQNSDSINHNTNYQQLVHSWKIFSSELFNDVKRVYPVAVKAAISKNYILAIDFYNRIDRHNDKQGLRTILAKYIKEHGKMVLKDANCKLLNRILGAIGGCSPVFLCFLCRRFYDIKKIFRFEVRKSV